MVFPELGRDSSIYLHVILSVYMLLGIHLSTLAECNHLSMCVKVFLARHCPEYTWTCCVYLSGCKASGTTDTSTGRMVCSQRPITVWRDQADLSLTTSSQCQKHQQDVNNGFCLYRNPLLTLGCHKVKKKAVLKNCLSAKVP